jgi:hypothetical protein
VAPAAVPVTGAVVVPAVVVPGVVAGFVSSAAGARSSTGAASCVPVLEQPASNATKNAPMIHLRMKDLLD